jgi:hypothetical protein
MNLTRGKEEDNLLRNLVFGPFTTLYNTGSLVQTTFVDANEPKAGQTK